jgi:3,4-dihydroxy 2-butanone 4-phosphate synthase/GTP cyclohydrolase II
MNDVGVMPMPDKIADLSPFTDVLGAIEELRRGKMIVAVDDESRENEGDLILPAAMVTTEAINFMAKHARGLICLSLTESHADHLHLQPMVKTNSARLATAFTVSVDARFGITTGISASDRARTIAVATAPGASASDLVRPGHIFPLRARPGGVLERAGHTEASVDLAAMAGFGPAAVICEIMSSDGTMARPPELVTFCAQYTLRILTIESIIRYRLTDCALSRNPNVSSTTSLRS